MKVKGIFILIFLLGFSQLFAQGYDPDQLPARKLKKYGISALEIGDPYTAADLLGRYIKYNPDNPKTLFLYAEALRQSRNYAEAEKQYQALNDKSPDSYPLSYYYKGLMQKALGKYEEAEKSFNLFRKKYTDGKDAKQWRMLAYSEIKGLRNARYLVDTIPLNVDIIHLDAPINRAHQEQAPIYYNDSMMIFTSLQSDTSIYYSLNDSSAEIPVRQLYVATLVDSSWKFLSELPGPFNEPGVNTANGSFSPDGKRFFFTRCHDIDLGNTVCHIYESKWVDGDWQDPEPLNKLINLPKYTSTQPSVGTYSHANRPDRDILYFSSNRPEGMGGMDIWYSLYDPKTEDFLEPRRLSSRVNTRGNEISPFYDNVTKTLYYSSDAEPGLGGMDIFKSTGQRSKWEEPINVGYPINTGYDDQYFVLNRNQKEGFFTSNRPGGTALKNETCCDDIYSFRFRDHIDILLTGTFFEFLNSDRIVNDISKLSKDSLREIPTADISIFLVDANGVSIPITTVTGTEDGGFSFDLQKDKTYKVFLTKTGFLSKEFTLNTFNITASKTIVHDVVTNKLPEKPLVLENIYYEFNSDKLTPGAMMSIDTTLLVILNENPNIVIELSSHTDSKGSDSYNEVLSQKRANSVVKYLISKGINPARLVAKGYGETMPVAPNENPDGTDNPEGRAKNRRTEFKILRTDYSAPDTGDDDDDGE